MMFLLITAGCAVGDDDRTPLRTLSTEGLTLAYPDGWSVTDFSRTNDPHRLAVVRLTSHSEPMPAPV
jgi:hypothetical protein